MTTPFLFKVKTSFISSTFWAGKVKMPCLISNMAETTSLPLCLIYRFARGTTLVDPWMYSASGGRWLQVAHACEKEKLRNFTSKMKHYWQIFLLLCGDGYQPIMVLMESKSRSIQSLHLMDDLGWVQQGLIHKNVRRRGGRRESYTITVNFPYFWMRRYTWYWSFFFAVGTAINDDMVYNFVIVICVIFLVLFISLKCAASAR